MNDSRSRRVTSVDAPAPRKSPLRVVAFVGAIALAVLALLVALNTLRGPQETPPLTSPSATAVAAGSPTASPGASSSGEPTPARPTRAGPAELYGFLTQTPSWLRSENDASSRFPMPQSYTAAVSIDGKRVAMLRTSQTGSQLVTFQTNQPQQVATVLDFAGTGEGPGAIAWAADNSSSVLISVHKFRPTESTEYTSLRVVDLATKNVTEIARFTDGRFLVPLYWDPATRTAAAYETGPGGFGVDYVFVRGSTATRTNFPFETIASSIKSDARTGRVLAIVGRDGSAVSTWRLERFNERTDLRPVAGEQVRVAFWRPNIEEVVVGVGPLSTGPNPPTRIEAWTEVNAHRLMAGGGASGLLLVRVDGTAALSGDFTLVDLETGRALGKIPRVSETERPYLPVLF